LDGGESAVEVEITDERPTGERYVWLVGNYAVRDAQGRVEGVGVVVQDVTKRTNAEEALRANNALLRLVADTVPDLLFARDRQHRMTLANPAVLALAGRSEEDVLGRTVREWWHDPRQAELILATDERIMATGQPERIEEEYILDGELRVFQAVKTPLRDRDGQVVGLVGVSRDITRERHYARSLERMVSERTASLSRSLASLEQLLYSIAHDLRAPNRAVHSFAELLEIEAADRLDPRSRLYLDRIKSAALRNDQLILDLLEYGRLAHADVPVEEIELEPVVREALLDIEVLVAERQASIEVRPDFPRVCANRTLLKQVLVNLLGNAVKYVPKERRPHVRVHAEPVDGHALVHIVDNGIGISPDDVGRVFEPFARLPNAVGVPGTGMGLAIVRKAAERMQGEVGVESRPGEGSRFWIRLPAAPCTG
ncbi:MAG: sensor histidine kinase, partial [Myxococcota bacterium]